MSDFPRNVERSQQREWRDPTRLEPYLDDALEHFAGLLFRMGPVAGLMQGMLVGLPDDPLLGDTATREEETEAAVLRALERLSPSAGEYYRAAHQYYARRNHAPAAASMLAHALRELDGTVRDVWWDLTCFVDDEAQRARDHARRERNRDAPHKKQIEALSRRWSLTVDERQTWLRAAGFLPKRAHRGPIGPSRLLDDDMQRFVEDALGLFARIARASESTYGDALLRMAALLIAGPTDDAQAVLSHHLPHHPPLRRWLLAQIDDPLWLRPLHAAGVLIPCEPIRVDAGGSAVAPMCAGARATARLAARVRDDGLLKDLVTSWLSVNNPRLHTDVVQILVEARNQLYELYVDDLCEWLVKTREHASIVRLVGDAGVLRFPSHCVRLAARALADGRRDLARQLAKSMAVGLAQHAPDEHSFATVAQLAFLGAEAMLDDSARRFMTGVLEATAQGWEW